MKKKIVYIIGHRSCDPYRVRNLLLVIKWLIKIKNKIIENKLDFILTILVVEQDSKQTVNNLLGSEIDYIFAYNAGMYNRGWIFNIGFRIYNDYDYFFCADNDIIIENIIEIFKLCFFYDAINPYYVIYDTPSQLFEYNNSINIKNIIKKVNNFKIRNNTCFSGGVLGLSFNTIHKISGWDERFRGRGWEDYAMTSKINLFIDKKNTFNNKAIHLWHPWEIHTDRINNFHLDEEYLYYRVKNYIKIILDTKQTFGCLHKYINENIKTRYQSDELEDSIIKKYKSQICKHCKINKHFDNKIDYSGGNLIYKEIKNRLKYYHYNLEKKDKKHFYKLLYHSLCDQHECSFLCYKDDENLDNTSIKTS